MRIDVLTLFPEMLRGFTDSSMLARAQSHGLLQIHTHNLRDWTHDKHRTADDRPFGGGAGMVLKPEPLVEAIEALATPNCLRIFLTPDGEPLSPGLARELSSHEHLLMLSGHYEGVDQRVRDLVIDREISIGDYVLTNGTLAAAVLIDCVARFVPGVLGEENSLTSESFSDNLLDFPQYTRPVEFRGLRVPEILLSGNHAAIAKWREDQRKRLTRQRRKDLLNPSHESHC